MSEQEARAALNTDREIWRGKSRAEFGDPDRFYADSIFVTADDKGIGLNCGGYVIVKPIREWFTLAQPQGKAQPAVNPLDVAYNAIWKLWNQNDKDEKLGAALKAIRDIPEEVLGKAQLDSGEQPRENNPNLTDYQRGVLAGQQAMAEKAAQHPLTFAEFSRVNRLRCESPDGFNHQLSSWSTSDWFTALLGELGEAANIAKKLNRVRDGIPGNKSKADELREKLRQELGDTFVYLDLLCQSLDISVSEAAVEVFNAKSAELGCQIQFRSLASAEPPQGEAEKEGRT